VAAFALALASETPAETAGAHRHGASDEALDEILMPSEGEGAPTRIALPSRDALQAPWLGELAKAQRQAAKDLSVFHDFALTDRQPESGITFRNETTDDSGATYKPVHYDHGNGVAVADVDGDGHLDLYFTNQLAPNQLWRNLGDGRFEDVTERAGVALPDRISVTGSFADTDNDGDPDLYVTTVRGGNALFENDGSGRFTDVTERAGLEYEGHSSGGVFFDYDRDGLLDLFLCNVGVYTTEFEGRGGYYTGVEDAFGGHLRPEERDEKSRLYRNLGDNVFEDVTRDAGLIDFSWTGDASPIDGNGDGWPDLYVLNMQGHDQYFENREGHFERRTLDVFPHTPWGSMGIKAFDWDNDGDDDLFLTDMHSDMSENIGPEREKLKSRMQWDEAFLRSEGRSVYGNAFFSNDGEGGYSEVSDDVGAENYWPWGLSVGDLNADGWEDVFITASMNYPFRYGVNSLLLNDRGRRFVDAAFPLGAEPRRDGRTSKAWFELDCDGADREDPLVCEKYDLSGRVEVWAALGTRSSVIFDLEGDGDLDVVTNDFNDVPMVLVSDLTQRRPVHFLKVRLVGTRSNRDGLGARVTLRAGPATYTRSYDGATGYLSHSVYPLYFGLGDVTAADSIDVVWPSGTSQTVSGPFESGAVVEVVETGGDSAAESR